MSLITIAVEMTEALKALWVKKLRAGTLSQTSEQLRRTEEDCNEYQEPGYCCLGVLGLVCGVRRDAFPMLHCGSISEIHRYANDTDLDFSDNNGDDMDLTPSQKLSFKQAASKLPCINKRIEDKLMEMNDNEGLNFSQIADFIERTPVSEFNKPND